MFLGKCGRDGVLSSAHRGSQMTRQLPQSGLEPPSFRLRRPLPTKAPLRHKPTDILVVAFSKVPQGTMLWRI
jgi:hypothetical protein